MRRPVDPLDEPALGPDEPVELREDVREAVPLEAEPVDVRDDSVEDELRVEDPPDELRDDELRDDEDREEREELRPLRDELVELVAPLEDPELAVPEDVDPLLELLALSGAHASGSGRPSSRLLT